MNESMERLYNGIVKENPTFVLMLGMCPTLAVTTSAVNGLGMGLSTLVVLMMSNWLISIFRNVIPDRVRIPAFIVIVASLVTVVQLLIEGFLPSLNAALGIYIPLIVVNCIILGRAEAYASKNKAWLSFLDGLGMGLGFTIALTVIGMCRELLGGGSVFVLAPGAFFVLALLTALQNKFKAPSATNVEKKEDEGQPACGGCSGCGASSSCPSKQ